MPAIDSCQPQVIRALEKAGWHVVDNPYPLRWRPDDRTLYADLLISDASGSSAIVVEIKCFTDERRIVDEFYTAIGQVVTYRNLLQLLGIQHDVFLSVPQTAFETFFQEEVIQNVAYEVKLKLLVVDLIEEEVVSWRP